MSVTTSQRLNADQLYAAVGGSHAFSITGAPLESSGSKTITVDGVDDEALNNAVAAAAGAFVDYDANRAALAGKARQGIDANNAFLALPAPSNAQVVAQVQRLSRENNALIKLLLGLVADTAGTTP